MFILRFAKALAALSCSGGVFIPVKVQYKLTITSFILRFVKALAALSCSGGIFYTYTKPKLPIYLKPYFATSVVT